MNNCLDIAVFFDSLVAEHTLTNDNKKQQKHLLWDASPQKEAEQVSAQSDEIRWHKYCAKYEICWMKYVLTQQSASFSGCFIKAQETTNYIPISHEFMDLSKSEKTT